MKKDKYLQIFNYLLEISKLRSPVRDFERSDTQYPDKIYFSDIPQYTACCGGGQPNRNL